MYRIAAINSILDSKGLLVMGYNIFFKLKDDWPDNRVILISFLGKMDHKDFLLKDKPVFLLRN